ncbi:MAG: NRAMP family divalent metal transporter [Candidatus Hydrogenedentota bacterium]
MNEETRESLLRRIGPGLITAAVVIGPGSIVASSRAGAEGEYRLVWMMLVGFILMATFTAMGARLACAIPETPLQYITKRWGRALAFITGLSGFLVTAGFQFGNNIGAAASLSTITDTPDWFWALLFTALALFFLIRAQHVYKLLEMAMIILVFVMLGAFLLNLLWTGLSVTGVISGLVPRAFEGNEPTIARAMLATTFSAVAAFYMAYLGHEKGWTRKNAERAIGDSWIGISFLAVIALIILINAAESLYGTGRDFANIGELATQLQAVLGPWATAIFSIGLAAASFSSFIANAVIGGALMADGLGQYGGISSRPVKAWTAGVMIIGCGVAITTMLMGRGDTTSLLIAQAATLIAAPLCAVLLFGLTSSRRIMGDLRNPVVMIIVGVAGLAIVGWLNLETLIGFFR